jgi:hypothetical protein
MKKVFLIAALCFNALLSSAQYHPMLDSANIWSYTSTMIAIRLPAPASDCTYPFYNYSYAKHYTVGDTILGANMYKKVYATDNYNTCLFGFLREDSAAQKVYFHDVNNNPEVVLYDFSMQLNDSINVDFTNDWGYFEDGYFTLDSITTVNIAAGQRRKFFLNCRTCAYSRTLSWVESVGNQGDVAYPYSMNSGGGIWDAACQGFPYDFIQLMTCFEHNSKVYMDTCALQSALNNWCMQFIDSCTYGNICSAIDESAAFTSFSVQPNPASDHIILTIDLRGSSEAEILLRDIYGRNILYRTNLGYLQAGRTETSLSLPTLSPGIYFIECRTANGSVFQKIIIRQ